VARYVIITPVRNEAQRIEKTADAIVNQTIRPTAWVIVDDGSQDGTAEITGRYAQRYPWISVIRRKDRGFREPGKGVIEAFYDGYQFLQSVDWDYLVKFDGDLSIRPDYFEKCFERFDQSPELGIGGGLVREPGQEAVMTCSHPLFHVRGATKIYRRACWESIGGLIKAPGWDTLDEVKANMLGWKTRTFVEIEVHQLKHTGSADGVWQDMSKNGFANYIMGYHPLFLLGKCVKRMLHRPYLVGGAALLCGYIRGYFKRSPRVDQAVIKYVRRQQLQRILGKESIWK
jgi:glycosyltransferase involved in cell wall biosynthesis